MTRNSKYLYVANYGDNTVQAFGITSATGELELIDTNPVGCGSQVPHDLAVTSPAGDRNGTKKGRAARPCLFFSFKGSRTPIPKRQGVRSIAPMSPIGP